MRKLKACPTYQRLRCLSGAASTPSTVLVAASAEKTRAVEVVKKGSDGADGGSHVSQRCGVQHFACAALLSADKTIDRKSTRLNSSHVAISYAVFCLKKKI